jgi:C4-dicarboxylate transporter
MRVIQLLIAEMVFNKGLNIAGHLVSLLSGFCHFQQEKGHKRLEKDPLKSN